MVSLWAKSKFSVKGKWGMIFFTYISSQSGKSSENIKFLTQKILLTETLIKCFLSFIYNFHLDLTFVFHNFVLCRSKLSRAEHHTLFAHVEPICTLSSSLYVKVSFFFLY